MPCKTSRTVRNLCPSSYGTLAYQHDQSFSPTPRVYSFKQQEGLGRINPFLHIKREKEQICSTETKEQACLNKTEGLELVRLLQMRHLTYLTKLTP